MHKLLVVTRVVTLTMHLPCRGFGTVSFPTPQNAQAAVERMNNADIGGRAVTVRIDRFA